MFVEYATTVDAGLSVVEKSLDALRSQAEEYADIAYRAGEHLHSRVGPSDSLARDVALTIGVPEIHRSGLVYPVHWVATGARLLFPELEADLILSQAGSQKTTLTLRGTYQPPLGTVGRLVDRALLRRVAEATVVNWIDRLAAALGSATAA